MQNKIPCFSSLVIFLLLFSATQVNAAIYKCPGKNGESAYQEKPCKKGQEVVDRALKPSLEQQARSHLRNAKMYLKLADVYEKEGRQRKENKRISAENERKCQKAKDDLQYWETQSRHNYTFVERNYDLERVEQAKQKARKACSDLSIK